MQLKKALYGLLRSSLLFYKKLVGDLDVNIFKLNPYDHCVLNNMVKVRQLTIFWHVEYLKISHVDRGRRYKYNHLDRINLRRNARVLRKEKLLSWNVGGLIIQRERLRYQWKTISRKLIGEFPEDIKGMPSTPTMENLFKLRNYDTRNLLHGTRK